MSGLRSAVGFLTPVGGASAPEPRALDWFPVVGASLGAVLGVVWWEAGRLWPAVVAASLVLVADLGLTGLLHVDGLADSADGLLPHLDKPRRLAVMSEPGVGAFAVAVVGGTMLLRWAGLW
ncbi:MAG TPA: adenosylcobinamide-GDP ribazoletransferase, partial [Acidimicrobiales bacterium]|nr:adenosylcobinamide-GDP ribazoletransferase [Acidimicrobiales bacterium]